MAFVAAIYDDALSGVASSLAEMSLHTADPNPSSGGSEVTGSSYARASLSLSPSSGSMSDSVSFTDLPGSLTVTHIGFWDGSGTWKGSYSVDSETWNSTGGTANVTVTISAS